MEPKLRIIRKKKSEAENAHLDPLMRALKALHSAGAPESMTAEELERQRRSQEVLGKLTAPMTGMDYEEFALSGMSAAWTRLKAPHGSRHAILYCHGGGYTRGHTNHGPHDDECMAWTNDWDFPENDKKDYAQCFESKIVPQVKEILTQYGELCLIWFDTPTTLSPAQSQTLVDMVHTYQPNCLINSRIGNGLGDYRSLGDNQIPEEYLSGGLFETPATLNDTWGYKSFDNNWKDARRVLDLKRHLNERGINYLLNVGPDYLGRIPAPAAQILRNAGRA